MTAPETGSAETGAVGFVGLGNIGKAMATRLVDRDAGLWVCDIAPEPVAELREAGAQVARNVADLAGRVDLVCVMVRDDDQVRDVLAELLPAAREGLVVAVHSTVAPDTPAELADSAAGRGVHLVDAPVSGGAVGAARGSLAVMVGGADAAFATCAEPFGRMGGEVVHAGPVGAGTKMKLARNLLHFVAFTAATEAQRLAEAAGLDPAELGRVVRHTDAITGGPGAIMYRDTAAPLAADDPWFAIFDHVRALGEKDLRFAIELAEQVDIDVPMARRALTGLASGLGLPPLVPSSAEES